MLTKPFGGAITFPYYPKVDGDAINPPSQTPSIYVFDYRPSPTDIDNGTNAIGVEITTWTETAANYRPFTIPAIADDAVRADKYKDYWVGIKYVAVASGSATYDVKQFRLVRPDGATADPKPTTTELLEFDHTVNDYYTDEITLENYIEGAETKLRAWFAGQGVRWETIENPEDLKTTIIYCALKDLWLNQRQDDGDKFEKKHDEFKSLYKMLRDQLKIEHDANDNDEVTTVEAQTKPSKVTFYT